jgi:hypothetical protein
MEDVRRRLSQHPTAGSLHRILSTSIFIFDSAITLLGEPSACGVQMPASSQVACMRNILTCLGIGDEDEERDLPFP